MSEFTASFNDGQSAGSHDVSVKFADQGVIISRAGTGTEAVWPYSDLRSVNAVYPGQPVLLSGRKEPDARLYIADPEAAALVLAACPWLSAKSKNMRVVVPMLAISLVILGLGAAMWITGYSPARQLAGYIPDPVRKQLGTQVVSGMTLNKDKCDAPAGMAALQKMSARLLKASGSKKEFRIDVVPMSLVNAFAVPGEQIVVTRGLLKMVDGPDELAGVVAHEIGHGLELHPETSLVRALGLTAVFSFVFGGSDIGGNLGSAGSVLVQLNYSRRAEFEADEQAIRILKRADVSPEGFAKFFRRVEKLEGGEDDKPKKGRTKDEGAKTAPAKKHRKRRGGPRVSDVISTHPPTPERIARINAAIDKNAPTTPILTAAEWTALKNICATRPKSRSSDDEA